MGKINDCIYNDNGVCLAEDFVCPFRDEDYECTASDDDLVWLHDDECEVIL